MYKLKMKILFLCALINLAAADNSSRVNTLQPLTLAQQNLEGTFQRTSVLYGLSTISNEHLIEQRCHAHLQLFQHGVINKQPWALKMFDASASIEPGFTFGNNFWLGNREVCDAVGHPVAIQTSANLPHQVNAELLTSVAPFETDYRVVYLQYNSTWQVDPALLAFGTRVHVGLCLPNACSNYEVQRLMETYLSTDLLAGNELFDMHLEFDFMKDLKLKTETFMLTSFILISIFIVATIGLTIAAMLKRKPENIELTTEQTTETPATVKDSTTPPLNNSQPVLQKQFQATSFLGSFDMQANWQYIFSPSKSSNTLVALNGIRFASALCVTFYHYVVFLLIATRNKFTLFNYQVQTGNINIFVDVFFTISAFLQAYNHFRNTKLLEMIRKGSFTQNVKLIGLHLFYRYLRLAPLYLLHIAVYDFGAKFIDDTSLFHIDHKLHDNCQNSWWKDVLFIQNFFNYNDMCGVWTWSLACDMQFAILGTVLLFTYVKHPRLTKISLAALVVANIFYTYFFGLTMNFDHSLESTFALLREIYINPLSRILAYIAGGIAGWYFVEQRQLPFALSKNTQKFLGYLVTIVFLGLILLPPYQTDSPFTATTLLILERIIFTSVTSILIVSNANGHMRGFFRIFETIWFQKFNKVAYAMYLLNPVLALMVPASSQSSLYANPMNMMFEGIGLVIMVVLVSTLFTLFFDIPYQNITKLLINNQIKRKIP